MLQILHITQVTNLSSVIQGNGLWSPNHMPPVLCPQSSAHPHIQHRRAHIPVPGGVLNDYVPFYFGARSPMLYANHRGAVHGSAGQRPIVYIVSVAENIAHAGLRWVFTDGHAVMAFTRFFDQVAHLNHVDWHTVHANQWADTAADPDRKRRKQAECLVHRFFPFDLVTQIAVHDVQMQQQVQQILAQAGRTLPVVIQPNWYY